MTRTTVHLLRHGEVDNPKGILYGRLPGYRLSAAGEEMAKVAATWFADRDITGIYSSPLERARQTVAPLEAQFGLSAVIEPRVIESENAFEGTRFAVGDGALRDPRRWWLLRNPFRPSWGEPYEQIAARMLGALGDARTENEGHEAVLVSHQLPVVIARRAAEGRHLWHRPDRRQCSLASVTSFVFDGDRLLYTAYSTPAAGVPTTQQVTTGA
jgi:broad specificity phosphatase PhoE